MGRLFGTDGVRGLANADLTPELALRLAASAAHILSVRDRTHPPVALVGRDPRASGEMLEAAVVAGLTSAGATVVRVGVLPTPAVAYLVGQTRADLGVMISASHNPMPDNGIKFFAAGGHKLPDELEDAIEAHLSSDWVRPRGSDIGRVHDLLDGSDAYVDHLVGSVSETLGSVSEVALLEATTSEDSDDALPLRGLKVVVDCANGAAHEVAPEAYRRAGAEVIAIHDQPDGLNINDECGSTHLDDLRAAVVEHSADLGVGLDGDADRCLAVDAKGQVVDGDQLMAVMAVAMRDAGALVKDTLVTTVMSNLGLRIAMAEHGIAVVETKVGDRYVLEELRAGGFSLGGEQSGHVVLPSFATTGDGTLTALQVMARMVGTGKSLAELASIVRRLPQVLVNVAVADKSAAATSETVAAAVADAEARLAGTGRVLLRPSGTEQLVRVMVEAPSEDLAGEVADQIAQLVRVASPV